MVRSLCRPADTPASPVVLLRGEIQFQPFGWHSPACGTEHCGNAGGGYFDTVSLSTRTSTIVNLENRKYVVLITFITVGIVFVARLFYMQVVTDKWTTRAKEITEKTVTIHAPRGIIYDRNGKKLVDNQTYYDLMVIPSEIEDLDTLAFCELVGITKASFIERIENIRPGERHVPNPFLTEISAEDFGAIKEQLYKFQPGFLENDRTLRIYPQSIAPHILGYLNKTDSSHIKADSYYTGQDYIGVTGIEKAYERELRGEKGIKYLLKDAKGLKSGEVEDKRNREAENGRDLVCTIDSELQAYGEKLMSNKIGTIVAIEPSSGEILAMVSAPSYDPNWTVGSKNRNKYFPVLMSDTLSPQLNRAVMSEYQPGSIFKMFQALVGMKLGYLTPQTSFFCDGSLIGDHIPVGTYQMFDAIKSSSNQWFLLATRKIIQPGKHRSHFKDSHDGLNVWAQEMNRFGLGVSLPLEIGSGRTGLIPDAAYYDKMYDGPRWAFSTIKSISIGQGEVGLTPLQMANLGCILANRGHYYYPHLVKQIGDDRKREIFREKQVAISDASLFDVVIRAMRAVIDEGGGTARLARTEGIAICGKTGTVENFKVFDGVKVKMMDHSVFMCFAPEDNPKIALAVYVENAGYGGVMAAPIASLLIQKYLNENGEITTLDREKHVLETDLMKPKIDPKHAH